MTFSSAIYTGPVVHERVKPKRHRLRYNVYSMLLDLDELEALDRSISQFGYNRFAPLSFHDKDHGPLDGTPLRRWVEQRLVDAGLPVDGGPIRLLCYPRVFGYVFNPLSVYFCYDRDETLRAILYEVSNTFHERHTYVIPVVGNAPVIRQACDKQMYVSPFIEMDCRYHFRIAPPGEKLSIAIRQEDSEGLLLGASFSGNRSPFTNASVRQCLMSFPLLTVKIMAGIHWEALKLWLKGIKFYRHEPATERIAASVVRASSDDAVRMDATGQRIPTTGH